MLHPSYNELMKAVNENAGGTEENPVVSSRYSIVIAAAKRARQLITEENRALEEEGEADSKDVRPEKSGWAEKPLSTAIRELMDGDVKIVPSDDEFDDDIMFTSPMGDVLYESDEDEDMSYDDGEDDDEADDEDSEDGDDLDDEVIDDLDEDLDEDEGVGREDEE